MGWIFVMAASVFEVTGAVGLHLYSQQKNVVNTLLYLGGFGLSFLLLYQAFDYLQLSIAYAVWVGLGTAGAVILNMILFGESHNRQRVLSLLVILIGVIGLKLVS
ncbi:DMT family transporter [Edaphobacillus lindanitolerans]|uniref:Paired small multidrug resistance pump n=1 Tax=Edaphobacillus lindanitolerans TaxID=550447 RepID=A0A1U7PQ16_9BACI|nr:multidrug efflux SMR transporter [Edaphobacillus lindanitolerans]SIT84196.1 paired small multidrug resistance pump [Edaphobacillus lindanitolerans]